MKDQIYAYTTDPNKPKKDYSNPELNNLDRLAVQTAMTELTNRLKNLESEVQTNRMVIRQLTSKVQKLESNKSRVQTRDENTGWDL